MDVPQLTYRLPGRLEKGYSFQPNTALETKRGSGGSEKTSFSYSLFFEYALFSGLTRAPIPGLDDGRDLVKRAG